MTSAPLIERVKHRDWDVLDEPGAIRPSDGSSLVSLLDNPDSQVRELTLVCLDVAGGEPAREGVRKALRDPMATVRAQAARFLERHFLPERISELERLLSSHPDAYVRMEVALTLGRAGQPSALESLRKQRQKEEDEHARHALLLALARLGDSKACQELLSQFKDPDPYKVGESLSDLIYVNDPKLLLPLSALLDDTRSAKKAGPSHASVSIRVCDVTIGIMDALLRHPFSFKMNPMHRYSPEDRQEAKAILAKIK